MKYKDILGFVAIIINALLLPAGQAIWKKALQNGYNINVFFSLYFWLGSLIYIIATLIWFYALSIFPLSKVYPFVSLSYILGAVYGYFIFNERILLINIIGYLILIIGLILIMLK